ncbi:MAG TPA: YciI family protein [Acidimicrobiia bacterium]|nr:YciI family protein [Acidimicrobiia bacterium]
MSKYLLSIYQPDGDPPPIEVLEKIMDELNGLNRDMKEAGVWVFTAGLEPPRTATVLRSYEGRVSTTDGPFVESKEHIGGFTVIEVMDDEAALSWAARLAEIVTLPVEVRPIADS